MNYLPIAISAFNIMGCDCLPLNDWLRQKERGEFPSHVMAIFHTPGCFNTKVEMEMPKSIGMFSFVFCFFQK